MNGIGPDWISETQADVRAYLDRTLPDDDSVVSKAVRYMIVNGTGKLLRPLLVRASAEAYDVPWRIALPYAAVVEGIHAGSLMIDDIRCMDDSDERRGRPAAHILYSESDAILGGIDLFFSYALNVISNDRGIRLGRRMNIIRELSLVSRFMNRGQSGDVRNDNPRNPKLTLNGLRAIYEGKSGWPMGFSLEMGPLIAGVSDPERVFLRALGISLGTWYQYYDDLSDAEEDRGKKTIVNFGGVAEARKITERLEEVVRGDIEHVRDDFERDTTYIEEIAENMFQRYWRSVEGSLKDTGS